MTGKINISETTCFYKMLKISKKVTIRKTLVKIPKKIQNKRS